MSYFTREDISARREKLSREWDALLERDEAVLIHSGELIPKPGGLDQCYPFLPHPAYYWLTARRRESEVLLYSKETGWTGFQKQVHPEEIYWDGERNDILVPSEGRHISELEAFLRKEQFSNVYQLGQAQVSHPKAVSLRTALDRTRRKKDASEIKLIREIARIANYGYKKIADILRPGISEKEIGVAYESEIFRNGAHAVPYDTVVGSGSNAAILHALPSQRMIKENEFVLIDAGADIFDYCVDITRTFYSSGKMDTRHKDLYTIVHKAHTECMDMSQAGVLWKDVHICAAQIVTEGLKQVGILKGSLDELLEKEVAGLFLPHGVGHLVGLRLRDAGQEENIQPQHYFGARLRVDLRLEENQVLTVEPGCYFMSALLEKKENREKYGALIHWEELDRWKHIGGVRIEDNILIKEKGHENLTACVPKIM